VEGAFFEPKKVFWDPLECGGLSVAEGTLTVFLRHQSDQECDCVTRASKCDLGLLVCVESRGGPRRKAHTHGAQDSAQSRSIVLVHIAVMNFALNAS
jgi:hypothetical protein